MVKKEPNSAIAFIYIQRYNYSLVNKLIKILRNRFTTFYFFMKF